MGTRTIDLSLDASNSQSAVSTSARHASPADSGGSLTVSASSHGGPAGAHSAPSGSMFSVNLGGSHVMVNASQAPVKFGGGNAPVTNDFGDVHLDTDGSHWTLTDGVDTIVLEGATAVTIDGQTYRLVDHFGAGEGGYQTIQEGVDGADAGDIVLVAGGDYHEQVVVDGRADLTIQGLDGDDVNVIAPADVVQTATSSSGREVHGIVTVLDSTNIQLVGIDVDGDGNADTVSGSNPNYIGVMYRNSSGGTTDVDVTGIRDPYEAGTTPGGHSVVSGIQRGVGVQVDNDTLLSFLMSGGSISDFQKNATVFNNADLDVSGVTITGGGDQTINAQNGMQAGNCTGAIYDCIVSAIGFAGTSGNPAADAYSGGILLTGNNTDLSVHDNTVTGANIDNVDAKIVGIYFYDGLGENDGCSITDNDVSYCDTGVGVYGDIGSAGISVSGNSVTNVDPNDYYYLINAGFGGVDFEPTDSLTVAFDVSGSEAADYLAGATANDTLSGVSGDDFLFGNDGDDYLDGGTGADTMEGGADDDTYVVDDAGDSITESGKGKDTVISSIDYTLGARLENLTLVDGAVNGTGNGKKNTIFGNSLNNNLDGGAKADTLDGNGGGDVLTGGSGDDTLRGNSGGDTIVGGTGDDVVTGGAGKDTMSGGGNDDTFVFVSVNHTGNTQGTADVIVDFAEGGSDLMDLSAIDANTGTGTDDPFSFIGTAAFSGSAGELREFHVGADTFVAGDVNGDGLSDFIIRLSGSHTLAGSDFGL